MLHELTCAVIALAIGSSADTAIWTKLCGALAEQLLLWGFNSVQQFRADSHIDLCSEALIAVLALKACSMQIALPNRTTFRPPAKRGLVQIAEVLLDGTD